MVSLEMGPLLQAWSKKRESNIGPGKNDVLGVPHRSTSEVLVGRVYFWWLKLSPFAFLLTEPPGPHLRLLVQAVRPNLLQKRFSGTPSHHH